MHAISRMLYPGLCGSSSQFASGIRTVNSLPLPIPSLVRHLNRSAVQLRQVFHHRQSDAQTGVRPIADELGLREHIENMCGSTSGEMPMPLSSTFTTASAASTPAFTQIVPPFLVKVVAF